MTENSSTAQPATPGHDRGRALIVAAFQQARTSGKGDWTRMAAGVLKNRMLQVSNREFDEHAYGADTFVGFLDQHPDLVAVDRSQKPPLVSLVDATVVNQVESPRPPAQWVRPDLWDAIMDYRSGSTYVWDAADGRARVGVPQDGPVLPTISEGVMREWRHDFGRLAEPLLISDDERRAYSEWEERVLSTYGLPDRVRPEWNRFVSARAIERLEAWFDQAGIQRPPDMAGATRVERPRPTGIRAFIEDVIRHMSDQELEQLPLPAGAVLRATSRSRRS